MGLPESMTPPAAIKEEGWNLESARGPVPEPVAPVSSRPWTGPAGHDPKPGRGAGPGRSGPFYGGGTWVPHKPPTASNASAPPSPQLIRLARLRQPFVGILESGESVNYKQH